MSQVSVTSKGQVTIPKAVRDALGITAGSKVEFDLDATGARLRIVRVGEVSRIEEGPALLSYKGPRIPTEELDGSIAVARSNRHARG
jgi:AbrB family looped-hinge helix DNA binding protein